MHVVVIGAGIVGVTTAFYLRQRGFAVTVLERNPGVAQETSFANAGVIAPAYSAPWAQPGMPRKLFGQWVGRDSPIVFRPTFEPDLWRWLRRWLRECDIERFRRNKSRMFRLALYSRSQLHLLRMRYALDYEQGQGRALLIETGAPHRLLTALECRALEPALLGAAPLAAGLYLPDDETGNCALFARQLRDLCVEQGVDFRFNVLVRHLELRANTLHAAHTAGGVIVADRFVVAAGCDSTQLLAPLAIKIPLYPVLGHSATVQIVRHDSAPRLSMMDEHFKVAITRMGQHLRIAGTAEIGSRELRLRPSALATLLRVAGEWFPAAANYREARFWVGARPMLPDGPPLLGATPIANLFLNLGHGSSGWAMACGSAQVVADVIAGRVPDIDLEGLTLARYGGEQRGNPRG